MSFRKASVAAVIAVAMTSAPVLAQANPAGALSVSSQARAGATVEDENQLGGGFLIPLLALGAIILGIVVALDDEENDLTVSP